MRRSGFTPWIGLLLLALNSLSAPAVAQTIFEAAPAASAEGDAAVKARELFLKGKALYAEGKVKEAYEAYKAAWGVRRSYDVAGNLGIAALELGKMREAAEYLLYCKQNVPVSESPERFAMIEERLAEARKEVAAVRVEVRRGGGSGGAGESAEGAEVLVDGAVVGRVPLAGEVFVDPGKHSLKVRLAGYADAEKGIEGRKGFAETVTLVLEPAEVGPGGGEPARKSWVLIGVGGGLAAAGLGVGIGLTLAANSKSSDAADIRSGLKTDYACTLNPGSPSCPKLKSTVASQDTFANVAVIGFAVGGAAALGLVTYLLVPSPKSQTSSRVRLLPWVGINGGGLSVAGAL